MTTGAAAAGTALPRTLSLSPPSLPPLPRALRQNRSFANLAKLIGIAPDSNKETSSDSGSDAEGSHQGRSGEEDDDDDDEEDAASADDVDEESLMWDAQTALIAHQPALAAKYYATAALPPYCSFTACLALGNLLARGSALHPNEPPQLGDESALSTSPQSHMTKSPATVAAASADATRDKKVTATGAGATSSAPLRSPQSAWYTAFFRQQPAPTPAPVVERPPPRRLTSHGWGLPTDGKRAVRDVEGMGKAGGWLILGIGWVIETEMKNAPTRRRFSKAAAVSHSSEDDDGAVVFDRKGKGHARSYQHATATAAAIAADHPPPPPTFTDSISSSDRSDSSLLRTPEEEQVGMPPGKTIKLLYDLLTPLINLYRHGHIQKHDPVALPPLANSQLPTALKPQGDKQKGRNAWALGSAVAAKLLDMDLLHSTNLSKEGKARQHGVVIMAEYILGLTSPSAVAESSFKTIVKMGPCGLELPDDLVRQACRRLNVIRKSSGESPLPMQDTDAYPFPLMQSGPRHNRRASGASMLSTADSVMHSALRLMTPAKSTVSLTSLSCETPTIDHPPREIPHALSSLRGIKQTQDRIERSRVVSGPADSSQAWWPSLSSWSMAPRSVSDEVASDSEEPEYEPIDSPAKTRTMPRRKSSQAAALRAVASSPELSTKPRRLPFEPTEAVATIDPELAALELASALTKHVKCSVCKVEGVNFPNCRKCGLTFCSRACRVDEGAAGNGKRHVCGAWESRRLLTIPESPVLRPKPAAAVSAAVH